ncbi:hypothetical protein EC55P1_00003 [Enterococcus phage EC55P1]|nr:hypothetical protein EC55P1_00003 [Enterococcus phage EC55P1]
MEYSVNDEMNDLIATALPALEELEIDHKEDEYTIVQPYDDGNAIIVRVVEEEGGRTIKVEVSDTVVVLPAKDGVLDVFA